MKVKIVTDSTSSFPPEIAEKENIGLFESKVLFDDKDWKELSDLNRKNFADSIPNINPYPTTTVASPQEVLEMLEQAVKDGYDEVLYIGVSPTISNQINSFNAASKKLKDKIKLTVHECGLSTSSQGALVHNALKLHKKGKTVDEIISFLNEMKTKTFTIGISPSFDILFRTGKVQKKASLSIMASVMKLKPLYEIILDIGARGSGAGAGYKGAIKKAVQKFSESISPDLHYDLIISEAFNTKYNYIIEKELRKIANIKDLLNWQITPCVMLSTGIKSIQITLIPHID